MTFPGQSSPELCQTSVQKAHRIPALRKSPLLVRHPENYQNYVVITVFMVIKSKN